MFRMRMAGVLAAALSLVAAACGEGAAEIETTPQATAPAVAPADAVGTESGDATGSDDAAEGSGSGGAGDEAAPGDDAAGQSGVQESSFDGSADDSALPADAAELMAGAATRLDGRSVRGEAAYDLPPEDGPGSRLVVRFESDAQGDAAVTVEVPPEADDGFPVDEVVFRFVDGQQYLRIPAAIAAAAGIEVSDGGAWLTVEPPALHSHDDPRAHPMFGLLCIFEPTQVSAGECDPLAEVASFAEIATELAVVGRDEVRGVATTRVSFALSASDIMAGALGGMPEGSDMSEGDGFEPSEGDSLALSGEMFPSLGITGEMWIDDEMLIRRVTLDLGWMLAAFEGYEADESGASPRPLTFEFYDFGADFDIEAPSPESIVPESVLEGMDAP